MTDTDTTADRRGRGRPSTGTAVQVRIPAATLAHVDHLAQAAGTTRAAWIRTAVAQAVAAS